MKAGYVDKNIFKIGMIKLLRPFWAGVIYSPISPFTVAEIEEPSITHENDILVDNIYSGICGSDITLLSAKVDPRVFPAALSIYDRIYLGHENLGRITELGDNVDHLKIGDRVTVVKGKSCELLQIDSCQSCEEGMYFLCENVTENSSRHLDTGGGWAPKWKYDKHQLLKIPDEISNEYAVLTEPFAIAVHAVLRKRPENNERILVYGAGFIGLAALITSKYFAPDSEVYVISRYQFQADMVEKYGGIPIMSQGYDEIAKVTDAEKIDGMLNNTILLGGFDIIYDCVGSDTTLQNSLRWSRARGTVVLVGVNLYPNKLDLTPVWYQEVNLLGSNSRSKEFIDDKETTSDLITFDIFRKKVFDPKDLITHKFRLDEYKQAINVARNKSEYDAIKVIFDFT